MPHQTSAPRALHAAALAATLLLAVLAALLATPASGADFHALGCYNDPTGDAGSPAADLVSMCVNHDDDTTTVEVLHATGIDPIGDPAWGNPETGLSVLGSIDGDGEADVVITLRRQGSGFVVETTDGSGQDLDGCPGPGVSVASARQIDFSIATACFGGADPVRFGAMFAYEPQAGAAVAMDRIPDQLGTPGLPRGDAQAFCANRLSVDGEVEVTRLRCGGIFEGTTEPVSQAIAVSQFVFDDLQTPVIEPYLGDWAVIVRDDNFADALAGSSLGFGQGPLLFAYSPTSGPNLVPPQDPTRLPAATQQELLRTVPRGFPVYVLGGTAAIDEGVVDHLRELGYDAIRIAGASREETAAAAAREVRRLVQQFVARNPSFPDTNMVLIANRDNWPDAVLAGQIGALWGMPILLNPATGEGHPATIAALDAIRPNAINFVGGNGVITSDTLNAIRDHVIAGGYGQGEPGEAVADADGDQPWRQFCARFDAEGNITEPFWVCRQGGRTRIETAAAVSQFGREMIQRFGGSDTLIPDTEVYATGVPLAGGPASDNYAYVLAASMMSGRFGGAVFLATEDNNLTETMIRSVCDLRRGKDTNGDGMLDTPFIELVELVALIGDVDKLSDDFGAQIRDLIEDGCPPEFTAAGLAPVGGDPD